MLNALKKLFGIKAAEKQEPQIEVPYKIETPAPVVQEPVAETATQAMVESVAPAKKKPAAKKPRKPKAPKQS